MMRRSGVQNQALSTLASFSQWLLPWWMPMKQHSRGRHQFTKMADCGWMVHITQLSCCRLVWLSITLPWCALRLMWLQVDIGRVLVVGFGFKPSLLEYLTCRLRFILPPICYWQRLEWSSSRLVHLLLVLGECHTCYPILVAKIVLSFCYPGFMTFDSDESGNHMKIGTEVACFWSCYKC